MTINSHAHRGQSNFRMSTIKWTVHGYIGNVVVKIIKLYILNLIDNGLWDCYN